MTPLLQVDDLHLTFGGRDRQEQRLLHGVSFTVAAGEAVGIVGESGSGKTLTLRAITALHPPNARIDGDIRFDGLSVPAMSPRELTRLRRDHVGMVFQDPHAAINPVHRIGDYLTETYRKDGRKQRRDATTRALELLHQVRIKDPARILGCFPHELSGGMLQRVMIAAALMRGPRLLLADEPTTALDVTTQAEVVALIADLRRDRGTSLVFITHDIELVGALCDRILVMYRGRIVEQLTPAQLHGGEISHPYTAALLACRPDVTRRRDRLPAIAAGAFEEGWAVQ
ncbi:ABC transporter ATP-binding protein [Streptomyces spongiae]|uniref:ABC transporter ATP-binding protein n=1 Tax=Streptomyces spongiae TaxID=565072 RepID=A0A5N8XJ92_9ACTN|nr:ABC transporter ATP-binding protein [Streptomyces spongiae]MPY59519.1 ABC transporter ATP-binding protein [Streptomyces spongiae]